MNYLKGRIRSFGFAFRGIHSLFKSELNAQIHLLALIFAVLSGLLLKISSVEWCIIIFAIAIVLISEAFNTVIEKIINQIQPEFNESTRVIKDISAGAVLISSIAALITGIIIFVPKLF
jgi:diacylglycerol kinase (ATP)